MNVGRCAAERLFDGHIAEEYGMSPGCVMRLEPALRRLAQAGFEDFAAYFREGVNAMVSGARPVE